LSALHVVWMAAQAALHARDADAALRGRSGEKKGEDTP
jgi:hypothetical protein